MRLESPLSLEEFLAQPYPGATRLIGALALGDFSNIPAAILDRAAERGRQVHRAIEEFVNTGEYELGLEYDLWMSYFFDWFRGFDNVAIYLEGQEHKIRHKTLILKKGIVGGDTKNMLFIATELRLVSPTLGFKGVIDAVMYIDGKLILCDWKTTANISKLKLKLQLTLYKMLFEEHFPHLKIDKLAYLQMNRSGFNWNDEVPFDEELARALIKVYAEVKAERKPKKLKRGK